DGGMHWSRPRRISVPATEALLPAIAAQGNERVAVLYLHVTGGASLQARYRLALSRDGGGHFTDTVVSTTFELADTPELTARMLVPGAHFVGDYMGLAGLGAHGFGALYVVANSRNQTDVYYAGKS